MIIINTDAAYNPITKQAGIGIIKKGQVVEHIKIHYPEVFNNHVAEFIALLEALLLLDKKDYSEIILFQADSKIVIESLEKGYVKNKAYAHLLDEILKMTDQLSQFYFKWIPAAQNKGADTLSKQALQKAGKVIEKEITL